MIASLSFNLTFILLIFIRLKRHGTTKNILSIQIIDKGVNNELNINQPHILLS
jgi:hypothetical protein